MKDCIWIIPLYDQDSKIHEMLFEENQENPIALTLINPLLCLKQYEFTNWLHLSDMDYCSHVPMFISKSPHHLHYTLVRTVTSKLSSPPCMRRPWGNTHNWGLKSERPGLRMDSGRAELKCCSAYRRQPQEAIVSHTRTALGKVLDFS